jgi:hypothetical protein
MDVTVEGSAAGFPLGLSLALVLPLRFAEANDSVPCRKLLDLVESRVLEELDLRGGMVVVVRVETRMEKLISAIVELLSEVNTVTPVVGPTSSVG